MDVRDVMTLRNFATCAGLSGLPAFVPVAGRLCESETGEETDVAGKVARSSARRGETKRAH